MKEIFQTDSFIAFAKIYHGMGFIRHGRPTQLQREEALLLYESTDVLTLIYGIILAIVMSYIVACFMYYILSKMLEWSIAFERKDLKNKYKNRLGGQ